MTIETGLMLGLWALALSLTLWGTWLSLKHFKSSPPHLDAPFGLYPVSILKPLKGADSGIRENLETFFHLDYPVYELLFSVADVHDPVCQIVQRLIEQYPGIRARIIYGAVDAGPNPKVNNMLKSYSEALFDWVLISDSNVRVPRDYLKRLVAHLDSGVGMVTAAVSGRQYEGAGGALEATYLHTFYARGMILTAKLGRPCVVGKCMLFRKSTAARFGGIETLARYLAEDYMAGEAMRRLGLQVKIATDPVVQIIGKYSFRDFWSRHLRWGRIRKAQAPLAFLIEPLLGSVVSSVLGAFAFEYIWNVMPSVFLTVHFSIWALCDILVMSQMEKEARLSMPIFWAMRELVALPLWAHIASGNTVNWRGSRLVLLPGGILADTE